MAETKRTLLERCDARILAIEGQLATITSLIMQSSFAVEQGLASLHQLGQNILNGVTMGNAALDALITALDTATNAIAARIAALTSALANVATPEQLAELTSIQTHLAALGADPSNPVPDPTPVPVPDPTTTV